MSLNNRKRLLIKISDIEEGDNTKLFYEVLRQFDQMGIKIPLKRANNKLVKTLNKQLPGLEVSIVKGTNAKQVLDERKSDNIRFVIHDAPQKIEMNHLSDCNSHVIEISIDSDTHSDDCTLFEVKYIINKKEDLYNIIESVMLDIQMFYYYGFDNDFVSVKDRKIFSLYKVEFCSSLHNNVDENQKYCSFASLCRNADGILDYDKYIKVWEDFVQYINGKTNAENSIIECNNDNVVNEILLNHPYANQISTKKLCSLISKLKAGRYVLVFLYSNPRKHKDINRLLPMLKGKKLRRGTIKVVPYKEFSKYQKESNFLYLYPFRIL